MTYHQYEYIFVPFQQSVQIDFILKKEYLKPLVKFIKLNTQMLSTIVKNQ